MRPLRGSAGLADWLDEYRTFSPTSVVRKVAVPIDDWAEPALFPPADRLHDTNPRWRERARREGYGRPKTL